MQNNKYFRYLTFGSLYFTQGTILGYFASLNAIYLRSRDLSLTDIGIFGAIALIPFVLKIFLGILSDRVNLFGRGHRKPYIFLGLSVQALCLILVPFIHPKECYWQFVGVAFILQLGMAWYDTCTDGLALDTTTQEEQGTIQGFMVGGRALGVIVASAIAGMLAENLSWTAVFWTLAALTLFPIPILQSVNEPDRTPDRSFKWEAFSAFKNKTVLVVAMLGFVIFFIIVGANQIVNPFLEEEFSISYSTAGFYGVVWGIGVVLGGYMGSQLMSRLGKATSVKIGLGVAFSAIILLAFIPNPALAWVLVPLYGFAYGTQQTIYFALAMEFTDTRIAASMFAILMAFNNIGQGAGLAASGFLADSFGYRWAFIFLAILNIFAIPMLPIIFKRKSTITAQTKP
jgi:PAT family beta-lactamase induction signal transducer AmpG